MSQSVVNLDSSQATVQVTRTFAAMRDTLGTRNPPEVMTPVIVEREERDDAPFHACARQRTTGVLARVQLESHPLVFRRSARQIATAQRDCYHFYLQMAGVWRFTQRERE